MNRGIKKIKSGLYDLVHHQKTKEFLTTSHLPHGRCYCNLFYHRSIGMVPVYIAAIINFALEVNVDFLFERFYEPVFFDVKT